MKLGTTILAMLLATAAPALAQEAVTNAVTNQGGGNRNCDTTTTLLANKWAQVISDGAGQPCVYHGASGSPGETCDPDSAWNWVINGHLDFVGTAGSNIQIQMYVGSMMSGPCFTNGSAPQCYGAFLVENFSYTVSAGNTVAIPFNAMEALVDPKQFQGFWVFAKPSKNMNCTMAAFATTEHN